MPQLLYVSKKLFNNLASNGSLTRNINLDVISNRLMCYGSIMPNPCPFTIFSTNRNACNSLAATQLFSGAVYNAYNLHSDDGRLPLISSMTSISIPALSSSNAKVSMLHNARNVTLVFSY